MHEGIDAANARLSAIWAEGNFGLLRECYTDDAVVMPPNADAITGHDGIVALFETLAGAGIDSITLETVDIDDHGDTVIEEGRYVLGAGDQTADTGKYIVVWKHEGGAWKLHKDIFNSSQPAG